MVLMLSPLSCRVELNPSIASAKFERRFSVLQLFASRNDSSSSLFRAMGKEASTVHPTLELADSGSRKVRSSPVVVARRA